MVDKRRGVVGVILVLSLIAFVGFSMAPLLGGLFRNDSSESAGNQTAVSNISGAQLKDLEDQARGYQLVLQREPDNETALRGFLQAKFELISQDQGQVADVVEPLQRLAQLHPETPEYGILLAQAQEYTGNPEGAAQSYRRILEQRPGEVQALQGLVSLLISQNRPEAAIGLLEDTLKSAPQINQAQAGSIDEISIQLILGQVYAEQQRYQEAIAVYDEAIKNSESDFRPVLAKAIILRQQGNPEDAELLFAEAIDLAPAGFRDQIKLQAGMTPTSPTMETSPEATTETEAVETDGTGLPE